MKTFNYNKLIRDIREWLADESNKLIVYEDGISEIEKYLADERGYLSPVDTSCVASWYLSNAIIECDNGDMSAASNMYKNAVIVSACGHKAQLDYVNEGNYEADTCGSMGSVTEPSLYLAMAARAGYKQVADGLYDIIVRGKDKNYFFEDRICVSTFVCGLYKYTNSYPCKLDSIGAQGADNPYCRLFDAVKLDVREDIEKCLHEVCALHIEQSRASTSHRTCEYEDDDWAIFPSEIFFFLDSFRNKIIEVDNFSHPLIDTPLINLGVDAEGVCFDYVPKLFNKVYKTPLTI